MIRLPLILAVLLLAGPVLVAQGDDLEKALEFERQRLETIRKVEPAVCCIFSPDGQGGGSGVLISPDGYALSNFHVTQANREMPVGLPDGKQYKATLIGIDPTGDVALIRLHGKDAFPYVELGDSDHLEVGDKAIAMGNPFLLARDYKPTITLGNVTGLHRHLPGSGNFNLVYSDCIQIDTPINPGNSGGPLFNLRGELVGINGRMTVRDRGRVNTGIGFAISINQIKNFLPALRHGEIVEHALIDATVRQEPDGRIVFDNLFEDGPAHEAGIELGDELVSFDGVPIDTVNRFANLIYTIPSRKVVEIVVRRDGLTKTLSCLTRGIPSGPEEKDFVWPGPPEGHLDWERDRIVKTTLAGLEGLAKVAAPVVATGRIALGDADPVECRVEYGPGLVPTRLTIDETTYRFEKFSVVRIQGDGEPETLGAAEGRRLRRVAALAPAVALARHGEEYASLSFAGADWAGKVPCVVLEGRRASNHRERWILAGQDHRLHRLEFLDVAGRLEASATYDELRSIDGETENVPTRVRLDAAGGIRLAELVLESFRAGEASIGPTDLAPPPAALVPNPYWPLLERVWPSVLKVYGAGHVRGIPAQGTAVVVDAEKGLALTNLTIMLATPNLYVVDHEGREWKAKVVKEDEARLLALLELTPVEGRAFPPALEPASSAGIQAGDLILSIGNAEDLAAGRELPSANLGVVTAVTTLRARAGIQDFPYTGKVFLNDAKVNPGAYGGPVIDVEGRWIGINAKIVESKATNTQVSYTVPTDVFLDFLPGHEADPTVGPDPGDARPVYHGIVLFDANPLRSPPAFIERVRPGSPAAAARLRADDLVLRADGIRIGTCADLEAFFATCRPGQKITLSVKRGSKILQIELTLEAKEE